MPEFKENTNFKLPGLGSREVDTPDNFREDQGAKDVGYCSNTESHMLPAGSSPLLARDPKEWMVPKYYQTTYTGSKWGDMPKKKKEEKPEVSSQKVTVNDLEVPDYKHDLLDRPDLPQKSDVPDLVSQSKEGGLKTYTQAWTDNDSSIQQIYPDFESYVTDVSGQGETASKAAKRKKATEGGFIWDEDIHKLK